MLEHAIAELEQALTIVEASAKFNEGAGGDRQAAFERECATSYRAALAILRKESERQQPVSGFAIPDNA